MCGIVGFNFGDKNLIKRMANTLQHRGPDQEGYYVDNHISLGHKRLSIIDLSESGKQPICNEDGTIHMVFNGEIYNYKELKKDLKHHTFKSKTDCEVILHLYEEHGISLLGKLRGAFAFALWDSKKKTLFLVRDRLGIKPLYYVHLKDKLLFASEIKALLEYEEIGRKLNENALAQFIYYSFTIDGQTLLKNIKEVLPGHFLSYKNNVLNDDVYWEAQQKLPSLSEKMGLDLLKKTLEEAVAIRLMSDVPLGISLSGGLDSSSITGILSKHCEEPLKTFTVGFGTELDEYEEARIVADYCGTEHREIHSSLKDITKSLPKIVWHFEAPFARPAVLSNYILGKEIAKHVTVAYCGEAGDEVFAGFNRYRDFALGRGTYRKVLWGVFQKNDIFKIPNIVDTDYPMTLDDALLYDITKEIPGVQTRRVERMTMAHSTEFRFPFLDYKLVELSLRIPGNLKFRENAKKYILQQAVKDYLPERAVKRKKFPFGVPIHKYFHDEFLEISQELLDKPEIRKYTHLKDVDKLVSLARKQRPKKLDKIVEIDDRLQRQVLFLTSFELWYKIFINQETLKTI